MPYIFSPDILTLSNVPASFWSDTCLPSVSETIENTGQNWQKTKCHIWNKVQNAISAAEMPLICYHNELRHDKTNKMSVRPAKTQISLGIRPVWSESSLFAWRNLWSLATHWVHSEDSDQTGQMPRLIWVFAGHTVILLLFFSCCGSNTFFLEMVRKGIFSWLVCDNIS